MRDRMKDEHYFIILSQKERKNIIMFEDAVKKTTLEKGELDRGTRNGYSILINSYEKEINLLYSLFKIIYVFLTIFLYFLKCPQSLIL